MRFYGDSQDRFEYLKVDETILISLVELVYHDTHINDGTLKDKDKFLHTLLKSKLFMMLYGTILAFATSYRDYNEKDADLKRVYRRDLQTIYLLASKDRF